MSSWDCVRMLFCTNVYFNSIQFVDTGVILALMPEAGKKQSELATLAKKCDCQMWYNATNGHY